jgi:hypothetical protein
MADKVTITFDANDAELQKVAKRVDADLQKMKTSATASGAAMQTAMASATPAAQQHAAAVEQVEHRHISARHAIGMFASTTGIARGEMMHAFHALHMFGAGLGAVVFATMMAVEKERQLGEENEKQAKKYEQLTEAVKRYEEERNKAANVHAFGKEGAEAKEEATNIAKTIDEAQNKLARLKEMRAMYTGHGLKGHEEEFRPIEALWRRAMHPEDEREIEDLKNTIERLKGRHKEAETKAFLGAEAAGEHNAAEMELAANRAQAAQENSNETAMNLAFRELELHGALLAEKDKELQNAKEEADIQRITLEQLKDQAEQNKRINEYAEKRWKQKHEHDALVNAPETNLEILNRRAVMKSTFEEREAKENERWDSERHEKRGESAADLAVREEEHNKKLKLARLQYDEEIYNYEKNSEKEIEQYRNQRLSAVEGPKIAEMKSIQAQTKAQAEEAMHRGDGDMAGQIRHTGEDRLGRLGLDAKRQLESKNKMAFTDAGSYWQSFGTSANNATPAEREMIQQLQRIVQLTEKEQALVLRERKAAGYGE